MSDLTKIMISIFIAILFLALAIIAYHFRDELKIEKFVFSNKEYIRRAGIFVRISVTAGIEDKTLRVRFLIPCRNMKQKEEILEKLPVIKHELLMTIDRPDVTQSVKNRRFGSLKKQLLQTVNNYSSESVNKLYLENYFFN